MLDRVRALRAALRRNRHARGPEPRSPALDGRLVAEEQATLADVESCYRLLLLRNPDPVGHGAYADQVSKGISVRNLVSYFVGCPEWIERRLYRADANTDLKLVQTQDFPLYVIESDPVVARELLATGAYEPHVHSRLRARLREGATFVDIGANVGFYSVSAAKVVGPSGRVIAIEPNPDNLRALVLNKMLNECPQVRILPFAASDEEGLVSLMKIVSIASTKRIEPDDLKYLSGSSVVYSVRLDDVLSREPRVDVIKCDVDGHDHLAMRGAQGVVERFHPTVVAELNPGTLRTFSRVEPEDYLGLFLREGYALTVLTRSGDAIDCGRSPERVFEVIDRTRADQVDLWLDRPSAQ